MTQFDKVGKVYSCDLDRILDETLGVKDRQEIVDCRQADSRDRTQKGYERAERVQDTRIG